jgi:hypothetical protein
MPSGKRSIPIKTVPTPSPKKRFKMKNCPIKLKKRYRIKARE